MLPKHEHQFNQMLGALQMIAKNYMKPDELRRKAEKLYGLEYEEALEMAYEDIINYARATAKGIKPLTVKTIKNG